MTATGQPLTRTEWAEQQVRESILRGEHRPGDPLVIAALAPELGVSATPLREALRRLEAEGLVELTTFGTARVATVDVGEAMELYELRVVLEPMALERSVAKADPGYAERVEQAWEALTVQRIATAAAHTAFHRELLSACDSAWLTRLATMLADRAGLMIVLSAFDRPADYSTAESHRRLKDLAVAGDASGAAEELARHLQRSLSAIRSKLGA